MNTNEKYRCKKCGHVCTLDEMEADANTGLDPEPWSNWICPKCQTWHKSLEEGWDNLPNTIVSQPRKSASNPDDGSQQRGG